MGCHHPDSTQGEHSPPQRDTGLKDQLSDQDRKDTGNTSTKTWSLPSSAHSTMAPYAWGLTCDKYRQEDKSQVAKMKPPDLIFPPEKSHSDELAVSSHLHTRRLWGFTLVTAQIPFFKPWCQHK